jgi:hypothetical protein
MNYGRISVKSFFLFIFDKVNYYWGRKLFNNFNTLSYNLFNLLYKKNICNHKYITDKFINDTKIIDFS